MDAGAIEAGVPSLVPDLGSGRANVQPNGSGPGGHARSDEPGEVACGERVQARGKFLSVGDDKLWVRGVTYGTFRPAVHGWEYPERARVELDFTEIAASGFNAVRTYTVPPRWLLDAALRHGLRVVVGLPWEEHVAFLDDPARAWSIEQRLRAGVQMCGSHPAILWYAVGNEIPSPIVRWHGRRRIERFLERLVRVVKDEDADALVTYVNYPSTEYLELPFLDLLCFNVYLESKDRLEAYLARLHNLAGNRPVVMTELGLDSRGHGLEVQAHALDWQVRSAFGAGCAGVFVFAWTDEWHRGGHDVEDWDFGLTRRNRQPKPALAVVRRAMAEIPFPKDRPWPRVSVIVCSYNGARTIRDCLDGLLRLDYPSFEVIVVDDGSTDATPAIAREYGFRLISTPNHGLGQARNLGLAAASGEIVAYIDDDAHPDPHWLQYLAAAFAESSHVGVGGPNIPPPGDGPVAECVANAPGGPNHVLISDREAEHLPGCNMAFRRSALEAIDGFDPRFRTAGDDVDVCWRLRERGWTLGFAPGAVVWHHRRNSVRAYWRQQQGYGRAEALLEQKWPEKHNGAGHVTWAGRLYGPALAALPWRRPRIYQGVFGCAPFQSLYHLHPGPLGALALMPEWYLMIAGLAILSVLGLAWPPLALASPLLALAVGTVLVQALLGGARAGYLRRPRPLRDRLRLYALTALLHLVQPLARLWGRLPHGLTPWRGRGLVGLGPPWPQRFAVWRECWYPPATSLTAVERALRGAGASVRCGGEFDRWDLEVRVGVLGAVRVLMANEEHGAGRQFLRFRAWPHASPWLLSALALGLGLAAGAAVSAAWTVVALLGSLAGLAAARTLVDCAGAMHALRRALPAAAGAGAPTAAGVRGHAAARGPAS